MENKLMNEILNNPELLQEKEIVQEFFKFPTFRIMTFLSRLPKSCFSIIIKHTEIIENLEDSVFKALFLQSPMEEQKKILDSDVLLPKIVASKPNIRRKYVYDMVDISIKIYLLSKYNQTESIQKGFTKKLIDSFSLEEFQQNISLIQPILHTYYQIDQKEDISIVEGISEKYSVSKEEALSFYTLFKSGQRELFLLEKIKDKATFLLYSRFNLVLPTQMDLYGIRLYEDILYPYQYICRVSSKPIIQLFNLIAKKENNVNPSQAFVVALQLYGIFGFDLAKKILDDKFTYITDQALIRASEAAFVKERRKYRLTHQQEFLSQEMKEKILPALQKKDISFFKNITVFKDITYINHFIESLENKIESFDLKIKQKIVSSIVESEIITREQIYKKEFMKQYKDAYYKEHGEKRGFVTCQELYDLFASVQPHTFRLDEKGKCMSSSSLHQFLLGNTKANNDCLLRIILNHIETGMNESVDQIINQFSLIDATIQKANGKLSLYSLLDVADICKASTYHLEPDLSDLSLDTISKIIKSHKHCSEPKEVIFKRALQLHRNQRRKICSTIPTVQGDMDGVKYEVLPFSSEKILTAGIDTGSCLKVGGKGEDFLEYISSSRHAVMVALYDTNGDYYVCPFIRNGNGLYGNGIDPKPKKERIPYLLKSLQKCAFEIMKSTNKKEPILFTTITDLNLKEELSSYDFPSYQNREYLPLESTFYSDYHKADKKTYIIAAESEFTVPEYYSPIYTYEQPREDVYIYEKGELGAEEMTRYMNCIAYAKIDYMNVNEIEKQHQKRNFKPLDATLFKYIVGNRDWFLAIDDKNQTVCYVLPNDARAKTECMTAIKEIEKKTFGKQEINNGKKRHY